jgi:hypothetical protein
MGIARLHSLNCASDYVAAAVNDLPLRKGTGQDAGRAALAPAPGQWRLFAHETQAGVADAVAGPSGCHCDAPRRRP